MEHQKLSIPVSQSLGSVSGEMMTTGNMDFLFVFAHGAGAGMNHPFMARLSAALATVQIGTLRYHFPYMERGAKRPDPPAIAEKTVNAAIAVAHDLYPSLPLLAGGKSFGGRMTSQAMAKTHLPFVSGLVFTGFPLHPAGKPAADRANHLTTVRVPMLFLQGTRDALASIALMEKVCAAHPGATLKKFEGADHSFKSGKADLIPDLATAIRNWTRDLAIG